MKVGITYDLKGEVPADLPHLPDDHDEEYDSPATIEALARVLRGMGHEVRKLGDGRELLQQLLADPPDFVFNFAEGQGVSRAREARVPAVLEMLGIAYTGSDPLTMAVTLDKDCARRLVASAGVLVPRGLVLAPGKSAQPVIAADLPFPLIVKPAWEGSSKGIRSKCLVHDPDELAEAVTLVRRDHCQPILVEEFIDGDELTVGILGNDPAEILAVMRVVPNEPTRHFVYSLEIKRDFRKLVKYECGVLAAPLEKAVRDAAMTAFQALGCRDVARIDFRLRKGKPYFLEVNPLPGLNPESSDLVIMAELCGWTYARLVETIMEAALARHGPSLAAPVASAIRARG
jgi:D-alanine-D-alanine ligase